MRCWVPGGRPPFRGRGPLPTMARSHKGSTGGAGGGVVGGGLGHDDFEGVAGPVDVAVFQGGVHQGTSGWCRSIRGHWSAAPPEPGPRPGSTSPDTPPSRSPRSKARHAPARRREYGPGPSRRPVPRAPRTNSTYSRRGPRRPARWALANPAARARSPRCAHSTHGAPGSTRASAPTGCAQWPPESR
jgi:hypothetical protein